MISTDIDPAKVEQFAGTLISTYAAGMTTYLIDIGHRTGLFAAAAGGPATAGELAVRAGTNERYTREWLSGLAAAGIFTYDADSARFTLPGEHAALLTNAICNNMAVFAQMHAMVGKTLTEVAEAFHVGGGVPYARFRPEFSDLMDGFSRQAFDSHLVAEWLPLAPRLADRLERGARVVDVGCGTGHSTNVLASAYPKSNFVGLDYADDVIDQARKEAADLGLSNVTFEVIDVGRWSAASEYDAAVSFDSIHDQAQPADVLTNVYRALRPGSPYLMLEPAASSDIADNIGNPGAPLLYGISVLHCMTVSLAEGGVGLGTVAGEQTFRRLLAEAGFTDIAAAPAPGDPLGQLFASRKPDRS